jgi:hypothetical protein
MEVRVPDLCWGCGGVDEHLLSSEGRPVCSYGPRSKRKVWRGVQFDSQLEADWYATLGVWGVDFVYHPGWVALSGGVVYEPDFQLEGDVLLEVKGGGNERIEKAWQAGRELGLTVVVARPGVVLGGNDVEGAGAVWEPKDVGLTKDLVFTKRREEIVYFSADVAYDEGYDGIRWFKAVGEDLAV